MNKPNPQTVLLVGGTGRTGRRAMVQLLNSGISVRAIIRPGRKLPSDIIGNPNLRVIEADLLSLGEDEIKNHLSGCDAVISCLGHVLSFKGILGPPYNLVTDATKRLWRGIETLKPTKPVKFILMTSVSVNRSGGRDTKRKTIEKALLWLLCKVLPPAGDNQKAADFLQDEIGGMNQFVQWTVIRPDTLMEGEVSEYTLNDGIVSSLFAPEKTNMANIAHFMCELVTNPNTWETWKGKLPVIINTPARFDPRGR